jgi:hypothetical protein
VDDKFGMKAAADRGIALGDIGDDIFLENAHFRTHWLTNKSKITDLSRLIKLKSVTRSTEGSAP